MTQHRGTGDRTPLSRQRILRAAVALADATGAEAFSMRRLAQELGVVPMALYKHVANKDELLDGMVDVVVGDIARPAPGAPWKTAVRQQVLAARSQLLHHRWAAPVIESRPGPTPAVLAHLDSVIGTFRDGGLSTDLTHHAMHALGTRLLGFSPELFATGAAKPASDVPDAGSGAGSGAAAGSAAAAAYPHVAEIAAAAAHDDGSTVGGGCDDQFEFEFALDLLLDGIERRHREGWTSR
ncbi:TetR/AcrR family transcriptional regulator [Streptomyces sp. NBC_00094]|uniref:TetR/AcrR family transcriptional regulator n=1 Tax=Streptomyces sp. NBC_00094 TaxID=2903620 RepID=UPI0022518AFF|nr:TetR/AcrR family transcriptional regulator C-terminal domain-containing protein [Streptomyces sp. NBC_00094]MCX5393287.1 TetR/AcrR family transcriptional regulator C-terminal domain-containing protein [Streptomyces sp. NBC_00094]